MGGTLVCPKQWQFAGREGVEKLSGQLSLWPGAENLLVVHQGVKQHGSFRKGKENRFIDPKTSDVASSLLCLQCRNSKLLLPSV